MMSVQPDERPAVELPQSGDLAFAALMDALIPEAADGDGKPGSNAGGGDQGTPAPAGGAAAAPAGATVPGSGGAAAGAPAGGDAPAGGSPAATGPDGSGKVDGRTEPPAGGAEQPAAVGGGADIPADWTASADEFLPKLGELSTKFEENTTKAYQKQAYDSVREEYGQYFDALEKHPRLLVGVTVPAIGKEGNETLRNSEDAKEWQEAVKSLLVAEIRETATTKMEESADYLQTIHASIDLFKNNPDLIPGTKGFDRKLADTFATMVTPYEVRVDGKLQGYSIPVQPIINSLRTQLKAAAAVPAPAAAPPAAAPAPSPVVEPPQAGIQSKAGSGAEKEDFSTLFGTIGLPNLQI